MITGVLVRFADNPSWCITDAKVNDFACSNHVVKGSHELRDGGCEIPPVDVEQIIIIGLQLPKTGREGDFQAFRVITLEIGLVALALKDEASGEFWRR